MSVPISIGMLSTMLFQVVDTYFVGQLGATQLAALSFASTVYFLLVGLFIELAVGVSIIIGKIAGAEETQKVKRATSIFLILTFLIAIVLSPIGIASVEGIFSLLGANANILPYILEYMIPLFYGMPFLAVGITCGVILRSTGNIKLPEVVFGIAGIINFFLDYVLIFGVGPFPELGIKGVAIGTVISWIFILIAIGILLFRDRLLSFTFLRNHS